MWQQTRETTTGSILRCYQDAVRNKQGDCQRGPEREHGRGSEAQGGEGRTVSPSEER